MSSPTDQIMLNPITGDIQQTISDIAVPGPSESTDTAPTIPSSIPLVGSLNSKEPMFYLKAPVAHLKLILQSAPEEIRTRMRANGSRDAMLDEIFRLRTAEARQQLQDSPSRTDARQALEKLLTLTPEEVENEVDTNPVQVRQWMEDALTVDASLTPRAVPEDRSSMIITILGWQVYAHKTIAQGMPHLQSNPNANGNQPTQFHEAPPPQTPSDTNARRQQQQQTRAHTPTLADMLTGTTPNNVDDRAENEELDESDDENEGRRKKPKTGIPFESVIKGFHTGTDAAMEQILSTYPGNRPGANRLNVTSIRGPRIVARIIVKNLDFQEHVAKFQFWKKTVSGKPTQAHMEAHTLARMMQLEILSHKSPLEALRHPSLEVGLRRLYAIMYVEKQVARGDISDKGTAWHNIEFLLESTPDDSAVCVDIEEEMTRRLAQSKRRISATKVIKESDNRRIKRAPNGQNNKRGGN